MSLINEALKRARIEAARRDAADKGVPATALPVYVPQRRRLWLAPFLGFVVGIAAFAVAAGAYYLARRPAPEEDRPAAAAAPEPPPVVAAEAAVPAPASAGIPETRAAADRSGRAASSPPAMAVAPESPAATATEPARGVPASAPAAAAGRDSPRLAPDPMAGESGIDDGRTYFVEAELPGGAAVKLDFIVWSETRPFAQINGELINPGQIVDGFTLLAVERERVELEGRGTRFWLRVR